MLRYPAAFLLAFALSLPAWATAPDIKALCLDASNMGDALCGCVAEKAGALSPDQQAFIAAMLSKDDAETARLRGVMPATEMMEAGMFLPNAPADCAREGAATGN